MVAAHQLARAWDSTQVRADPERPGRWLADVDEVWTTALVPLGGVSAAVAARAMASELVRSNPDRQVDQQLRSVHCLFVAPVPSGPLEADVTVLRSGRSMSQAQVTLHAPGQHLGLTALAAFGSPRVGYRFTGVEPPDVPPPEACPSFRDPPPPEVDWEPHRRAALWDHLIEGRSVGGLPPWDVTSPRTSAEAASWYRLEHPPTGADGFQDPLVSVVLGDLLLGGLGQRVGGRHAWFGPSADLTVHLFGAPRDGWILSHTRAHRAVEGYASVEGHLWSPSPEGPLELVAYATQQMFFSFPEGPPEPHELEA